MTAFILFAGIVLAAAGLLFVGQGSGFIEWPASSFMIRRTEWIYIGLAIAGVGGLLIFYARQ